MSSAAFQRPEGERSCRARSQPHDRGGELLAILGPTGCGKSTTFNLIAGLIRPSSGSVRVMGHDPYDEFDWFRGKIGIVFQSDRLMPWRSALDNVALGLELNKCRARRRATAQAWLERLGLKGHENDFRMRCRAACASVSSSPAPLPSGPRILLCDEPFSGLDAVTGDALRREFADLRARDQLHRGSSSPIRSRRRCSSAAHPGLPAAGAHRL